MLQELLDINYMLNNKLGKRPGLKKRVYNLITEVIMSTSKDNLAGIFAQDSQLEQELITLLVSYQKNYNLTSNVMVDLCKKVVRLINDLCFFINERTVFCGNFYNDIGSQRFINIVAEKVLKNDQE